MRVQPIEPYNIYQILSNPDIPRDVKVHVAQQNADKIRKDVLSDMTKVEYLTLLKERHLQKFRPIKNSLIKRADMYILAGALGITKSEIQEYITKIIENDFLPSSNISKENIELTKAYIYRHGKKDEALKLLENELSDVKHILIILYRTLEKNSGGVYDYFERPIHLLSNHTAKKMHRIINTSLKNAQESGYISQDENIKAADWALRQIYNIQSNYKILKAARIVHYEG